MFDTNQKGNTMMEALAAISVVTVLAVAAVKLMGGLFDMFKQNMIVNEVQEVQKNISARYRLEGNYSELAGMDAQKLKEELLVPSQMVVNGTLVHRLNGAVEIAPSALGDEYFDITFKDLTTRSCMNMSQINWTGNQATDLFQIKINDNTFKLPINGVKFGDENALPVTVKKAADSCKDGLVNDITWTFQ